jgi:hypothetical protein
MSRRQRELSTRRHGGCGARTRTADDQDATGCASIFRPRVR